MSDPPTPLLDIKDLRVQFTIHEQTVDAVKGVDMSIAHGETVGIVGESGSGKSVTALAALGLLPDTAETSGTVILDGHATLDLSQNALNAIRGVTASMIFQEPMTSLDPLYRVGRQVAEVLVYHQGMSWRSARDRAVELLDKVGIDNPARRLNAYPHELSGGQRQRVMIAMALANNPKLLIADEPTTALDATVQVRILALLKELQAEFGMAIAFITHDLGIVSHIADRVYVMKSGEVVEHGPVDRVLHEPRHDYTRMLIDAEPSGRKPPTEARPPLLQARDLHVHFPVTAGLFGRVTHTVDALDGVSLDVRPGQTLGIVGESGSGKTTLGRALLRLQACAGEILFDGHRLQAMDRAEIRPLRRHMQLLFQDPNGSLSPRLTVGEIITEGLLVHEPAINAEERQTRAIEALETVGLPADCRQRFPHEFSGGQRQRIAIARALILKPKLVVLDEPTSALDRTVQKQVVDMLRDLQSAFDLTYVFISHDLAVVRAMADEIIVMRHGRVVEQGSTEDIFERPRKAYTRDLIAAASRQALSPA